MFCGEKDEIYQGWSSRTTNVSDFGLSGGFNSGGFREEGAIGTEPPPPPTLTLLFPPYLNGKWSNRLNFVFYSWRRKLNVVLKKCACLKRRCMHSIDRF